MRESARRTAALLRHNTMLMVREPGPLASRMILPLAFLVLLHPLYEQAQGPGRGITQAVIATLVTFSLLAMSLVGGSILTERIWHTWDRLRATAARPGELLIGKAVPVVAAMLAQQAAIVGFGVIALGLTVRSLLLLAVALNAWTLTLIGIGAAIALFARSVSAMSAWYDIGGMILSSLGGALVPLAAMPHWTRHTAPATPGYWAVSAVRAALSDHGGRTLEAAAALLGFALAAGVVAGIGASRRSHRSATL